LFWKDWPNHCCYLVHRRVLLGSPIVEASTGDGLRRARVVVRQGALGLDLVGVQAKRYDKDATVQRPDIQAFVGALQGAQTSRGVFVTTGKFSPGAKQFAENVAMPLRLIDGKELTKLMVRYNVGVQVSETFELQQIDEEAFEE
jgi:restriction system protein